MRFFLRPLVFSAILSFAAPVLAAGDVVRDVKVEGTQRIEPSAVKTYFGVAPGHPATQYDLDSGLKRVFDTGFFSDVNVDQTDGIVTVKVKENPSINDVIFEGNDKLSKEDLEKEITLKSRAVYTRTKVQNDLKRLLDVYRRHGRYSATITPQIIPLEQNRVNLVYNITEGPKALIEKITFIGNESFDPQQLQKVISSAQERWYQFLSDNDKYDPDRLQYDQELLRKFYFENGYADFKMKSAIAELSPQKNAFYLTFTMEEGPVYHLGKVDVVSKLPKAKLPDMSEAIFTKTGEVYNATEIEDSIEKMTDKLGDSGFAFVEINPDTKRVGGKEKTIDLTYNISEGPRVYVDRINITGNSRTLDSVIRREFRLAEGDAYSSSKLKRTEERLNNLGYFEKVDIQHHAGSAPDKTDIDVDVKEKSTGQITFGVGYSTTDGPLADLGVSEKNFLGRGQELRARTLFAARRQMFDVGFTEPYFLDRELEAGFDVYKTVQDYQQNSSFDREAVGGILKLGYKLGEHLKHQFRYTLEQSEISNVDANASTYIKQQEGKDTASIIGHSFIYDKRNSKASPNSGVYLRFNQDVAGLGGDDQFLRHEVQGEYYYPIAKRWTFVGAGSAGNILGIGKDVRINQRFFVGSQEIRGFDTAGIGPRDALTKDALGGNSYYTASAELRFPLGLPEDLGVSGSVFTDAASLWSIDGSTVGVNDSASPRVAAGAGVAWASPFGPIRIDAALPLTKQNYDETQLIRFSFGSRF